MYFSEFEVSLVYRGSSSQGYTEEAHLIWKQEHTFQKLQDLEQSMRPQMLKTDGPEHHRPEAWV